MITAHPDDGCRRPQVGVQGVGCMGMSFAYGRADADASRAALERALEPGVTLYDTADAYGAGDDERFLAPFLAAHRDEVLIATKYALSIRRTTRPGASSATTRRTSGRPSRRACAAWTSTSSTSTTCTGAT
ncbi:hypothetical protein SALBM217S_05302 [Streptomyces griseoloalbus]